jgi:hypothetical protein
LVAAGLRECTAGSSHSEAGSQDRCSHWLHLRKHNDLRFPFVTGKSALTNVLVK